MCAHVISKGYAVFFWVISRHLSVLHCRHLEKDVLRSLPFTAWHVACTWDGDRTCNYCKIIFLFSLLNAALSHWACGLFLIFSFAPFCPLPFRWQVDFPHIGRSWAFHNRQSYLESRGQGCKAGWSTCLGTSGCVAHVRARNGRLSNYSSSLQRDQRAQCSIFGAIL